MLLSDDEIQAIHEADDGAVAWGSYRAVEAAILAKLASAELPEPAFKLNWRDGGYKVTKPNIDSQDCYTADQLRQAFAQGAASQLSAKPIGEFEALPDPTVGEIPWLNIYDIKSRVVGTKLYTLKEPK